MGDEASIGNHIQEKLREQTIMAFLRGSSIYCIGEEEMDIPKRVAFSSVCITAATISSFGAIVQLVNWYKRLTAKEPRRRPSPTPHVAFSLALADLFACIGRNNSLTTHYLTSILPHII